MLSPKYVEKDRGLSRHGGMCSEHYIMRLVQMSDRIRLAF